MSSAATTLLRVSAVLCAGMGLVLGLATVCASFPLVPGAVIFAAAVAGVGVVLCVLLWVLADVADDLAAIRGKLAPKLPAPRPPDVIASGDVK